MKKYKLSKINLRENSEKINNFLNEKMMLSLRGGYDGGPEAPYNKYSNYTESTYYRV